MRIASVLEEAWLNLRTGTTRGGLFAVCLILTLGVLAGAEMATAAALENQANAFRRAGGSTLTYTDQGHISGQACDALASVPTVVGAGAIRPAASDETALALPSTTIPTFDVSPTFGGFSALGGPPANRGVLISNELAAALHLRVGDPLRLEDGTTRVGGIYRYPQDGREPGYGYAILVPTGVAGPFDECWVESWPQTSVIEGLLTSVVTPGTVAGAGAPPVLAQLNGSLGRTFDGKALFDGRLTRFAPLIAALVTLAIGFTSVRLRRLELASARHAGVSFVAQLGQIAIETAVWVVGALVIVLCGIVVAAGASGVVQPGVLVDLGSRVLEAGGPAALLGAFAATAMASENHLFRYFKDR
jgi:hypothetical protein